MAIPNISVRHPRAGDIVDDPVEVAGVGTGFEGTLVARLRNAAGEEIAKRSFQAGGTGIWGSFFFRIDVPGVLLSYRGGDVDSFCTHGTSNRVHDRIDGG